MTGNKPVPDLQGMFLRGIDQNNIREPIREPGKPEPFTTALPTTKSFTGITSITKSHKHTGGMQLDTSGEKYNAGGKNYAVPVAAATEPAGEHKHTVQINGGGDDETRPVNVAVYFYIKIN